MLRVIFPLHERKELKIKQNQILTVERSKQKFLQYLQEIQAASPLTLKSYDKDLSQALIESDFGEQFHNRPIKEIHSSEMLQICRHALSSWSNLAPASRQRKCACLKSYLNWLYMEEYIDAELASQLPLPKVPAKIPHFISVDEALILFKCLEEAVKNPSDHLPTNMTEEELIRDHALIGLLYGCGLRVSEAGTAERKNLQSAQKTLRVLGKGDKERIVVLPGSTLKAVQKLPQTGRYLWGDEPLDPRKAYLIVREWGQRAGFLKPLHPHALRHSFATHMLSGGTNLRTLQELLGHSTLTATQKYLHLTTEQLANTLENHHPLSGLKLSKKPR